MFYKWLLSQRFRFYSFYIRPGRNISGDFLSRVSENVASTWATENGMTRIYPLDRWNSFCNADRSAVVEIHTVNPIRELALRLEPPTRVAEWQASGFFLLEAANQPGQNCEWVDPRHSRIARQVVSARYKKFAGRTVHFIGWMAKDSEEAHDFTCAFKELGDNQGLLIAPYLLELTRSPVLNFVAREAIDTALRGDILANRWQLYSFGLFDLRLLVRSIPKLPPTTFEVR